MVQLSEKIVRWLRSGSAFPGETAPIEVRETHISWVFLAREMAYKLKKPVRFDFLNFSTPEKREQACRDELRLNRRLAPNVYLDVLPINEVADGRFDLDGDGRVVDWLLRMTRLPADRMLDEQIRRQSLAAEDVDRLAAVLTNFYRSSNAVPISAHEYRKRCRAHVNGNRLELLAASHHMPARQVKRVHCTQLQLLCLHGALFDERVRAGRIIEGHGDLRPEHVCLLDTPVVFDCIEFSQDFRTLDVADELSFFAMECDLLQASWIGQRVLEQYQQATGDHPPGELVAFYKSYRACVHAKIAALRADQVERANSEAAIEQSRHYLALADEYLRSLHRPLLLIVSGLSGTGKSTLARAISNVLGAEPFSTDDVRQELFGAQDEPHSLDAGIYQPGLKDRVYREMLERAAVELREQNSVVLDGTFIDPKWLRAAKGVAESAGTNFLAIECDCPEHVCLERIGRRQSAGDDASQATAEVYRTQRMRRNPWPDDVRRLRVYTEEPIEAQVEHVIGELKHVIRP